MVSLSGTVSAKSSDLDCKMALADISDFQKPKQYDIIPDEDVVVKDFVSLTWTSSKDLLVCRSYDGIPIHNLNIIYSNYYFGIFQTNRSLRRT